MGAHSIFSKRNLAFRCKLMRELNLKLEHDTFVKRSKFGTQGKIRMKILFPLIHSLHMRCPIHDTASELQTNYISNMHRQPTAMQYRKIIIIHDTDDTDTGEDAISQILIMICISSFCFISYFFLPFRFTFYVSSTEVTW